MRSTMPVFIYFFASWAVMTIFAFFTPWLTLPDLPILVLLYLFYFVPKVPLWRFVFPLCLLMDLSAQISFGFHGVLYAMTALMMFPLRPYWQKISAFSQLLGLLLFCLLFQLLKIFFLYMLEGIPASINWFWTLLAQILVLPLMRGITLWFIARYIPRAIS